MGRHRKIRLEESTTPETTEQVMEQAVVTASPTEAMGPLGIVEVQTTEEPIPSDIPLPKTPETPTLEQRCSEVECQCKSTPKFECVVSDSYMPEKTERDGYYLKVRAVTDMTGVVYPTHSYPRDVQVRILTGVKYNSVFKRPHFVKELPELCDKHESYICNNSYDYNGELAVLVNIHGFTQKFAQGSPIAELTVI